MDWSDDDDDDDGYGVVKGKGGIIPFTCYLFMVVVGSSLSFPLALKVRKGKIELIGGKIEQREIRK